MLNIHDEVSLARALDSPIAPAVQRLLTLRRDQSDGQAQWLVIVPGDRPDTIAAVLGFSLLENLVDGVRYGDPDFEPSWEWIQRHDGGWFELVFILTDDGFATVLFIHDDDGTDPELLALCRDYAPAT